MRRVEEINKEVIDISEDAPKFSAASSQRYLESNFDISRYIKQHSARLSTIERIDGILDKIEEVVTTPEFLSQVGPKGVLALYSVLTKRVASENALVQRFVNDAVANSLLKRRMMLEQKKLEREAEVEAKTGKDQTIGQMAKQLKSILRAASGTPPATEHKDENTDFNGEI